jgi:tRNA U34 2-thiouridine synthase MnmA/TrmU
VERLERLGERAALVHLRQPFSGVAPGQSAVFYRGDVVVGGGRIGPPAVARE